MPRKKEKKKKGKNNIFGEGEGRGGEGGDVAHLVEQRTGTPPTQVRFPGAATDFFSPKSQLSVQTLLRCPYTPRMQIACINICAHVKDPVVHVRVRWNMETLKHPAYTVGWVARLSRSWFSPRGSKATRISHVRNPVGTVQL